MPSFNSKCNKLAKLSRDENITALNVLPQVKFESAGFWKWPALFIVSFVFLTLGFPLGPTCGTVISHPMPPRLNRTDYLMAVIYTFRSYSRSWNRGAATNSVGRKAAISGSKAAQSPVKMRAGAVFPIDCELVAGIFVCDNDSHWTHLGRMLRERAILLVSLWEIWLRWQLKPEP